MEPLAALGISAVWGLYGAYYFIKTSKSKGKSILLEAKRTSRRRRNSRLYTGWTLLSVSNFVEGRITLWLVG